MIKTTRLHRLYALLAVLAGVLFFSFGIGLAQAAIDRTMGPGSTGQSVMDLQTFLATDVTIYPEGLVTGYYGTLTTAAVQRFQCKYGIVCSGSVETTGYGRVGPLTLAKIILLGGGGGNVGIDVSAPIISLNAIGVATTSNTAMITWTTNEPSRSRVMYGTAWPFLYASAASFTDASVDVNSSVTLSGLTPNTLYFYVLESVDAQGNLQWSTARTLRTNP